MLSQPLRVVLFRGRKKEHKHKLFGPDFPRRFLTLTLGCPGVKKFLPFTGAAEKRTFWCGRPRFSARTSMTRRVPKKLCTKNVCVDFWPLVLSPQLTHAMLRKKTMIAVTPPCTIYPFLATQKPLGWHICLRSHVCRANLARNLFLSCEFLKRPRFGSVTVRGWNGSSGSGFRFRRFLCKGFFFVLQCSFTGKDGSGSGCSSWKTVPAVPVPLSVSGKTVLTVPVSGSGSVPEPPC